MAVHLQTSNGMMDEANFSHAQEFRPERWLSAAATAGGCLFHHGQSQQIANQNMGNPEMSKPLAHNRHVHIPFGNGPRICPGRALALLEIKTAMAMICHHFEVTLVGDPKDAREIFAFAMMPSGLQMRFQARAC